MQTQLVKIKDLKNNTGQVEGLPKNPRHDKAETFNAFGQIMSYQYLLSKTPYNPIIILATSNFEFYYFDFIKQFNLSFDVIINNKEQTAFWLNEFKNV